MNAKITSKKMSRVLSKALKTKGLITQQDTSLLFFNLSLLKERLKNLIELFPNDSLHAAAVKANPLIKILKFVNQLGIGAEAASLPELYMAAQAGIPSNKIVFDSPVKTKDEIEYALKLGVNINADSFDELDRIDGMKKLINPNSYIGVRINPQAGTGKILSTSVAGEYSKFGVPIKNNKDKLLKCFLKYDWLTGVHLHIGSQGCDLNLLVKGVEIIFNFVTEVNRMFTAKNIQRQIKVIDIGGGLPVLYRHDDAPIMLEDYIKALKLCCKDLFSGRFKIITEFGRYIYANTGWAVSRVEYVKREKFTNTAMIHLGADMFLRKAYNPENWHHDISSTDANGSLKQGQDNENYIIAGPLCFAGDIIANNITLPIIEPDDFVLIHDTGAYTLSMWSRYNSRQIPKIIGYYNDGEQFVILKNREELSDLLKFWS